MKEIEIIEGNKTKHLIFNNFKENLGQLKYSDNSKCYEELHIDSNSNLLAISNKFGLLFMISPTQSRDLIVFSINELLDNIQNSKIENSFTSTLIKNQITVPNIITTNGDNLSTVKLVVSNTNSYLSISFGKVIKIYSILDFISSGLKNFKLVLEIKDNFDGPLYSCQWNYNDEYIAVTTSSSLYIVNISRRCINKIKTNDSVLDACWDPKNPNQLFVGIEGDVLLIDKSNPSRPIKIFKNAIGDDYKVSTINLVLDKYIFVQYFKVEQDEFEDSDLYIFNIDNESVESFPLPFFPLSNFQTAVYTSSYIRQWNIVILASNKGAGPEIFHYNNGQWENYLQADSDRVTIDPPIVGMSLVTCYNTPPKNIDKVTEDASYPPVPILLLLLENGSLQISNFFNTKSKGQPIIQGPQIPSEPSQPSVLKDAPSYLVYPPLQGAPLETPSFFPSGPTIGILGTQQPTIGNITPIKVSASSRLGATSGLFGNQQPTIGNITPIKTSASSLLGATSGLFGNQQQPLQQPQQPSIKKSATLANLSQSNSIDTYSPTLRNCIEKYENTSIYNSKTPISQQIKKNLKSIEKYYQSIRDSSIVGNKVLDSVKEGYLENHQIDMIEEFQDIIGQLENQTKKNEDQGSVLNSQVLKYYSLSLNLESYLKDSSKKNYQDLLANRKLDPSTLELRDKLMKSYNDLSMGVQNVETHFKVLEQQQKDQPSNSQNGESHNSINLIYQSLANISQTENSLKNKIENIEKKFNKINLNKEKKEKLNDTIDLTQYTEYQLSKLSLDTVSNGKVATARQPAENYRHEVNVVKSNGYKNLISILKRKSNQTIKPQSPDFTRFFKSEDIEELESDEDDYNDESLNKSSFGSKNNSFSNSSFKFNSNITPVKSNSSSTSSTPHKPFPTTISFSADKFSEYDEEDDEDYEDYEDEEEEEEEEYDEEQEIYDSEEEEDYSTSNINNISNNKPIMNPSIFGNATAPPGPFGNNSFKSNNSPFGTNVPTPSFPNSLSTSPLTIASPSPLTSSPAFMPNLEKERLEKEKQEKERSEKEKQEKERLEKEKLEKERLEKEKERLEKEKQEKERLEKEARDKAEKERLEKEARDKAEKERLEKEAKEKAEKEKLEKEAKEKAEKERLEKEAREKAEKERLENEAKEKAEKEKLEKEARDTFTNGFGGLGSTPTTTPGTSPFGTNSASTIPPFGTANQTSTPSNTSIFSGNAFKPAATSVFGSSTSSPPSSTSVFGQPSSSVSPFGQTSVFGNNSGGSVFGQSQSTSGSVFGNNPSSSTGGSVFGSNSSPSTGGSVFGSNSSSSTGGSVFGSSSNPASAFGQTQNTSSSPTSSTTPFGATSQNTSAFARTSVFGGGTTSGSVFGSSNNSSGTFGNSSAFGGASTAPTTSAFGQASSNQSVFGSTSAFGGTNAAAGGSVFGQSSTPFGGGSVFGGGGQTNNGSVFGGGGQTNNNGSVFGQSSSNSSVFGSFGNTNQPAFGGNQWGK
ncbi:hypothetical protein DICPUDRAFT_78035 [Dictyostelium purpureum]|uniref:Uncharacterized protein n=1 Tax=Dictyostelium purpureum TaxID=5786 RepID=F0ZID1_DICPU|nr:uncharacterized protein DICPUDRAFT_78035 [Dictyostelium purpureum]EGC36286.1 hypothetical protein DICPUDRAFT_78035 [Dictyostelium purpureum]|eukprot:XP_003287164.1 hypothetical protein DICPUDRAFT_78035 [Dictyostelium purpureum]